MCQPTCGGKTLIKTYLNALMVRTIEGDVFERLVRENREDIE